MSDQNQPHTEVELFRAIQFREIEERDELHGSPSVESEIYNWLYDHFGYSGMPCCPKQSKL